MTDEDHDLVSFDPEVASRRDAEDKRCKCGVYFTGDADKCSACRGEPVVYYQTKKEETMTNKTEDRGLVRHCQHVGCGQVFSVTGVRSPRRYCDDHNDQHLAERRAKKAGKAPSAEPSASTSTTRQKVPILFEAPVEPVVIPIIVRLKVVIEREDI